MRRITRRLLSGLLLTALFISLLPAVAFGATTSNESWYVRVYNVDDIGKVYLNGTLVKTVGFKGDSGWINVTNYVKNTVGNTAIRFTMYNKLQGYTWGFQIAKALPGETKRVVWSTKAGTAGVTGANNNDQSKPNRIVYDKTVYVKNLPTANFVKPTSTYVQNGFGFGGTWTYAKCPTCGKYYKHVGQDVDVNFSTASVKNVYASEQGFVKYVGSATGWKYYVIIEHTRPGGAKATTTYWHLGSVKVKAGDFVLRNTVIGTLATSLGYGSPRHLHFGVRTAAYSSTLSSKGALPACTHKPAGLPAYPEKFVNPTTFINTY